MTAKLIALGVICVFLTAAAAFALDPGRPMREASQPARAAAPLPAPPPAPAAVPPPPAAPNRLDCGAIRGTPYLSAEERDWYRANCLGR